MPLDYFFLGEMRNDASHNCLDTMGRKSGEEVRRWHLLWKKGLVKQMNIQDTLSTVVNTLIMITGGYELLPWARRKSSVCLHQATAGLSSSPPISFLTFCARWCPMTIAWTLLERRDLWSLWGAMVWGATRHGFTTRWTSKLICIDFINLHLSLKSW